MKRCCVLFRSRILVVVAVAAWQLISGSPSVASTDHWESAVNGVWQNGANWLDGTTPGGGDTAFFNLAGAYTVSFNGTPFPIQALAVSDGTNATFTSASIFNVSTLQVTSASDSEVLVTHGATLTLGTSGGIFNPDRPLHLTAGDGSFGIVVLTVQTNATLNVAFGSDVLAQGFVDIFGGGQVNILGSGSTLTSEHVVRVGRAGMAQMNIGAGGRVDSRLGAVIGDFSGGNGMVTASGTDSILSTGNTGPLVVGYEGTGALMIQAGGNVFSLNGFIGAFSGSNGMVTVTGPGSTWTIYHLLSVGGDAFSGTNGGTGTLTIGSGGAVNVPQETVLFSDGTVTLDGGSFATSTFIFQGGQFQWNSGTLHIDTFDGSLTNPTGGTLAPGRSAGSTLITGNYTQQSGAALEIEIGGTVISMHDFVNVSGTVLLGGELQLKLIDGFIPAANYTFTVLNTLGGIAGVFSNVTTGQRLTTVDSGGSFLVHYGATSAFNPNQIVLTAFAPFLPGDYNADGTIDAADYVVWRKNEGTTNMLPNDEIGGMIGQAHFDQWRSHFGQTAGSGALSNATVPEPAILSLLMFAAAGCCFRRRRAG